MFFIPVVKCTTGLSDVLITAIWASELLNTNSAEFSRSRSCFVSENFLVALLILYTVLTLVPLSSLVMHCNSFPQYVKVAHFSWFLSARLPSSFF
jgi:hypothetical protein